MKKKTKTLLRALYIGILCIALVLPGLAVDSSSVPSFTTSESALELIRKYEGFSSVPFWDTQWQAIGYGTRYSNALEKWPGITSITEEQAMELVKDELVYVERTINSFARNNGIILNQNQFDALVDFTYNVGSGWTTYKNTDGTWCLLKQMLLDDPSTWTETRTREAFGTWVKVGTTVLEGLVRRRADEATLFLSESSSALYSDVSSTAWYAEYVEKANELDLMHGFGNSTFGPDQNLTRAQMVKALANLSRVDLDGISTSVAFSDVDQDAWYCPALSWAYQQKIINGYADGTFQPDAAITREQLCAIMARYLRSLGYTSSDSYSRFLDDSAISDYAKDDVYLCVQLGLVNGFGDGSFQPSENATRAQIAKILAGMYSLIYGNA